MMVVIRGNGNIVVGGNIVINGKQCVSTENGVIGCGKVKAERRQVDRVDSIVVEGSISLMFSPGGVEVEMPSLMKLILRGLGNAEIEKIDQPSIYVELNGSGEIEIADTVDHFTADLNGSGDIVAKLLKAKTVDLSLNGSGDISAHASESIKARLNGSGDIKVSGQPMNQDCVASGSGDIQIR